MGRMYIPDEKGTQFVWTIEGIDMNGIPRGQAVESPVFSVDAMKATKFSLFLYPRGHASNEGDNFVSLYLRRHDDDRDAKIYAEYVMGLIDNSGARTNILKCEHSLRKNSAVGFKKFCRRNLSEKSMFYVKDLLTVFCVITIKTPEKAPPTKVCQILSRDFSELLVTGLHSDMTIFAGGEKFNVHRVILEFRCPSLMAQLELKGDAYFFNKAIEAEIMRGLLRHLYSGTFSDNGMLQMVLVAAQVYGLPELKKAQFFPKARDIKAITKVTTFRVSFEMNIRGLLSGSKTVESYLVISDEVPEFCWMKVSMAKKQSGNDDLLFQVIFRRLYDSEITFIECNVYYYNTYNKVELLKCEHLFESENKELVTQMSLRSMPPDIRSKGSLRFEIRTSANNEKYWESTIVKATLSGHSCEYIDYSGIFQKDLRKLYANMKYADLTLCVEDEFLPVHKAILCARSEVFLKMFEHETLEKQTGVVKIEDVDLETMKSLLRYVYYGDVDDSLDVIRTIYLYVAADKYQLLELRSECSKHLKSSLSVENFGEVILLADLHHDQGLKKCSHDFVTSHAIEIIDSKAARVLKHGYKDLYNEILDILLHHMFQ